MSRKYKHGEKVPSEVLVNRLEELSDAVTKGKDAIDREFTMRIPAELDRDPDLVLSSAAKRINDLEARLSKKSNLATELERRASRINELEKQLAESVPKKDIQTILEWCYEGGLNKENVLTHATILTGKFEKLLNNHKE